MSFRIRTADADKPKNEDRPLYILIALGGVLSLAWGAVLAAVLVLLVSNLV